MTSTNILDAIFPMHIVSKFVGYMIFSISRKDFSVHVTKMDFVMQALAIICNVLMTAIYSTSWMLVKVHDSYIARISIPAVLFGSFLAYNAYIIWTFVKRHQIALMIRKLHEVDCNLGLMGITFDYQRQKVSVIKFLSISIITGSSISAFTIFAHSLYIIRESNKFEVFLFWNFLCGAILNAQVYLSIHTIKVRFHAVNLCIK